VSPDPIVFARQAVVDELLRRSEQGSPALLVGPPGAGKSTLLAQVAAALAARGARPVLLDLLTAASTPERFVETFLRALPAEGSGPRLADALALRRLTEAGRPRAAEAVQALFELLASADRAGERPLVLLLDEPTEVRSLAYFPGLRHADQAFADALRARRGGTLLATSYPTLARKLWRFPEVSLPPLGAPDVASACAGAARHVAPAELAALSFGLARYARILVEQASGGQALTDAWVDALRPGGRLEQVCRATYETLLLRSRGYGACKAALHAVALEPGLNLTALVGRLGRTPGATRDYLHWLVAVDALRMERKRYGFVDGLLGLWVRLYGAGSAPLEAALRAACVACLADAAPDSASPPPPPPQRARHDRLMEID
jgi:hypothetical protein